jgi:hypothetical protein
MLDEPSKGYSVLVGQFQGVSPGYENDATEKRAKIPPSGLRDQ